MKKIYLQVLDAKVPPASPDSQTYCVIDLGFVAYMMI
jgi:hypothetical protein